ncbi:hypothetical protein [Solibacillus sp. CAU 1738]|uniref:hypothetical protein n=1 Tax=Solibacillus sp. CAU 1738 TaxID=3140363 RepID=UPI0032615F1A
MNESFDAAFELFIEHRIDEVLRDKELSKHVVKMIAEIELKLNEIIADFEEREKNLALEALQDLFIKYNHDVYKNMYIAGFYDGLYLDKKSNKR